MFDCSFLEKPENGARQLLHITHQMTDARNIDVEQRKFHLTYKYNICKDVGRCKDFRRIFYTIPATTNGQQQTNPKCSLAYVTEALANDVTRNALKFSQSMRFGKHSKLPCSIGLA